MKFKLLKEHFEKINSNFFITDNPYDVRNLFMNKPKLYRVLYDFKMDLYMICDGNAYIHRDMLDYAIQETGYYHNMEKFIDDLGGIESYVYIGQNGAYDDDIEIDSFLYYIVFSPDDESWKLWDDGYDKEYTYEFGNLFTRECDLEETPLFNVLKPYQTHRDKESVRSNVSEDISDTQIVKEVDSEGNLLTVEQTDYFKGSKVRDVNGNLLVCYHGYVGDKFNSFQSDINWFTPNIDYAKGYSLGQGKTHKVYLNLSNIAELGNTDSNLFQLLPLRPPFKPTPALEHLLQQADLTYEELVNAFEKGDGLPLTDKEWYTKHLYDVVRDSRFSALLRAKGFDGISTYEEGDNLSYGVFSPLEIKSVNNKHPTRSDNIMESE